MEHRCAYFTIFYYHYYRSCILITLISADDDKKWYFCIKNEGFLRHSMNKYERITLNLTFYWVILVLYSRFSKH